MLRFFASNARWLMAAILITLMSSFGQTFFISIFAAEIMNTFDLSDGEWGAIYFAGTLASAVVMLKTGLLADQMPVGRLATLFFGALACACIFMAMLPSLWFLPFAIFFLRLCGQGMLSHIAVVALARWFVQKRGQAVAIGTLGYGIGEALLPPIFVLFLGLMDWRLLWGLAACIHVLAILPLLRLLKPERHPRSVATESEQSAGLGGRHWQRREVVGHFMFLAMLPMIVAPGAFVTALFFQQVHLAGVKGWSHIEIVALFPVYTSVTILSSLFIGPVMDRLGAQRMAGVVLLPMAAGFIFLGLGQGLISGAMAFLLIAVSQGVWFVFSGSFWADQYGTNHLGGIKALITSLMVLGSALGPLISGLLIDMKINFDQQSFGIALYLVLASLLAALAVRRAGRAAAAGSH